MSNEKTGEGDLKVQSMSREFRWNGLSLPDPDPSAEPDDVRGIYSGSYPELATATVKGPTVENDRVVYSFQVSAGVKG